MKFEDVVRGVVSSPARVNACSSKDFNHVGEAEVYRIRRGRSQCGRGNVGCRGLRRSSANRTTRGRGREAYDQFFTSTDGMTANLGPPIPVIDSHNSLEELVVKFEWGSLVG